MTFPIAAVRSGSTFWLATAHPLHCGEVVVGHTSAQEASCIWARLRVHPMVEKSAWRMDVMLHIPDDVRTPRRAPLPFGHHRSAYSQCIDTCLLQRPRLGERWIYFADPRPGTFFPPQSDVLSCLLSGAVAEPQYVRVMRYSLAQWRPVSVNGGFERPFGRRRHLNAKEACPGEVLRHLNELPRHLSPWLSNVSETSFFQSDTLAKRPPGSQLLSSKRM